MSYKVRLTTTAPTRGDIFKFADDANNVLTSNHVSTVLSSFYESETVSSAPFFDGEVESTLPDGRFQCVRTYSNFASIEDAEKFMRLVSYGDTSIATALGAWNVDHDVRSKFEVINADGSLAKLLHDNTVLEQKTIPIDVTAPDPFYLAE